MASPAETFSPNPYVSSVYLGAADSWKDLVLIPASRPVVAPPELKTNFVEVPGMNGSLDLTDVLAGEPLYSDRKGTFEFIVYRTNMEAYLNPDIDVPGLGIVKSGFMKRIDSSMYDGPLYNEIRQPQGYKMNWYFRYQDICQIVHGRKGPLIMGDDPEYFYKARFTVDSWETGDLYSTVTIGYTASPYKYKTESLGLYRDGKLRELEKDGQRCL